MASRKTPHKDQLPLVDDKPELLANVRARAMACHKCELHLSRTKVVFGIGPTVMSLRAANNDDYINQMIAENRPYKKPLNMVPLAFVGEAPGANEDLQGEPFVGQPGMLLNKMIEAMGYERSQVYLCNTVCCLPLNDEGRSRDPSDNEMDACYPLLRGQLRAANPKVIVAMGSRAARALTGSGAAVSLLRGRWWSWEGKMVRVTYHPAFLLRDEANKPRAWEDLQEVMKVL